jgi:sialate O-acetylesterase
MKKLAFFLTFISFNSLAQNTANQTLRFAQLFSNHIVFQRDKPIKIWGYSKPNETVEIFFDSQKNVISANSEGKWKAELPSMPQVMVQTKVAMKEAIGQNFGRLKR